MTNRAVDATSIDERTLFVFFKFETVSGCTYLSKKSEGGWNGDVSPETPCTLALACRFASLLLTVKQCRTSEQLLKQSRDVKTSNATLFWR